mmetsp:Transcript_42971/g.71651  ORF Transcript_42971/g.71651 Transcript_42971/m.71651 type:complete len:138 (-) Transcript_42971:58-471(-)|eukprot:CAMPEP_0198204042 /NCGR_PEP_ID=MMETSP1445-20131203/7411_1 /TAXON_ID=36898 /ORGANISM="Pyramimonas sp., Strain CCMP2087" /LENGTH=137 /DNA_ID=CAMNT_0043875721 /DNA_START=273 /DNA_END=686 /DNA_ORIENTATION=+
MLLSGLAAGVHTRVEKFSKDTPKKLDTLVPEQALLAKLKDTAMGSVERSQKLAPNVPELHETVVGLGINALTQRLSEMESSEAATTEERKKVITSEAEGRELDIEMMFKEQIARHHAESVAKTCPDLFQHPYRLTKT